MLTICDELAGLFLNLSRYSRGTDREFWLEAWNGKAYVVERMGRPAVAIDHLPVGMTGGNRISWLAPFRATRTDFTPACASLGHRSQDISR
jgi:hypothetical protein